MAGPLATILFIVAAIAIVVAHALIIRSTLRTLSAAGAVNTSRSRVREFVWAVVPAVVLIALLVWTWRTMHPDSMTFQLPPGRTLSGITT
jgi:heme/copper-type cytochrome/quinol oxidase subunit 2